MNAETQKPAPVGAVTSAGKHRRKRWIPWLAALLLLAAIVAGMWPKPVLVETAVVKSGPLRVTVNEEGKTRIRNRYVVTAPVAGQLRRIELKAGAAVKAGETVVAIIEPPASNPLDARSRALAEARRDSAAAQVGKAKAGADWAASELKRIQALHSQQASTPQELESAQMRATSASRELAMAESTLRQAEAELAEFSNAPSLKTQLFEVKSPAGGRVLRVIEESARPVTAGMPLLEIGDPADLEVVIEVLSRDGAIIQPGMRVDLEHWGGEASLEARVRLVEPAAFTKVSALGVEEQRVRVIADLVTPPDQRASLGDQFRVEASVVVWESKDTVKVPNGALFRKGAQWATFIFLNGLAELRPLKTGREARDETQVLEGLKAGDEVILYPSDRVKPGKRIERLKI